MKKALLTLALSACLQFVFSQGEIPVDMYTGAPIINIPLHTISAHDISEPISLSYNAGSFQLFDSEQFYGIGWSLNAGGSISRKVRCLPDDFQDGNGRNGWLYNYSASTNKNYYHITTFPNTSDTNPVTNDETADYNFLTNLFYQNDTEPDEFNYSFGGYSGKFVFDNSGVIRTVPYRDLLITPTYAGGTPGLDKTITSFTVKTNDGVIYTFGQTVRTTRRADKDPDLNNVSILPREYHLYSTNVVYNSEWKLTKIESPSGAYMDFYYTSSSNFVTNTPVEFGVYVNNDVSGSDEVTVHYEDYTLYSIYNSVETKHLNVISGSSGEKVIFQNADYLEVADARGNNGVSRNILRVNFGYRVTSMGPTAVRLLKSITTAPSTGTTCDSPLRPIQLEYYGEDISPSSTYGTDFWGYFNAMPQINSIPMLYFYPSEPLSQRYRLSPIASYTGTMIPLEGALRHANSTAMLIGVLNKIYYSSGGEATIEYEGHTFYDEVAQQTSTGGGLRVKSVEYFDGVNQASRISKEFSYLDDTGKSSGRLISKPEFAFPAYKYKVPEYYNWTGSEFDTYFSSYSTNDRYKYLTFRSTTPLNDLETTRGSLVGYKVVTVSRPGAGKVKYEYHLEGYHGQTTAPGGWSPTIHKIARPSTWPSAGIIAGATGANMFPYAPNPNYDHERGLMKKSTEYDEAGNIIRTTEDTYQTISNPGFSAGVTISGVRYDSYAYSADNNQANNIWLFGKYSITAEIDKVLQKETETLYIAGDLSKYQTTSTEYFYEPGTVHRLLRKIQKIDAEGTEYNTYFKYPIDYTVTANSEPALLNIQSLTTARRYGSPVEVYASFKKALSTEKFVSGLYTKYGNFSGKILPSEILGLTIATGLSTYNVSSQTLSGSTYMLTLDPNYEVKSTVLAYTPFAQAQSVVDQTTIPKTTLWGYNSTLPVSVVSDAKADQMAFSDFDAECTAEFTAQSAYLGEGRSAKGVHASVNLFRTINKHPTATNYILSFWLKKFQNPVTLRFTARTGATTHYTNDFVVSPVSVDYEYFRFTVPVSSLPSSFLVSLTGIGLSAPITGDPDGALPTLDDVAFYPETSDIAFTSYEIPFGPKIITDGKGIHSETVYDSYGRVKALRDQDKNIQVKKSYKFGDDLLADFNPTSTTIKGVAVTLQANDNACLSGVVYKWVYRLKDPLVTSIPDFSTVEPGTVSLSVTFAQAATYEVFLNVSQPLYGNKTVRKDIVVIPQPLNVDICAKGVEELNGSTGVVMATHYCPSILQTPTTTGVIFRAEIYAQGTVQTYQWKRRELNKATWSDVGTGQQYSISSVSTSEKSFEVMCTVTTTDGRVGDSGGMRVTIYDLAE
jgi:hypothetical protein